MFTTYTKKQANVIYRAMKEGKLSVSRDLMSKIYGMADESAEHFNDGFEMHEIIPAVVTKIFEGDYVFAQGLLDEIAA